MIQPIPDLTRCDFCSATFTPRAFNQRTCHRCAAAGAPDQSKETWGPYRRKAADWSREHGGRPALAGAALEARQKARERR
jgi:DnaJ-class molecular chaperone